MKNTYFPMQEGATAHDAPAPQESTVLLTCEQIIAENNPKIPKNEQNAIIRLAASVKKYGVLEPLCVKLSTTEHGYPAYLLVDGMRRLRAAMLAGLIKVPCIILPPTDKKCLQLTEITAIKRQNLHYFALAERFLYLIQTLSMTQEELARKLGLSQSAVANKLRLLQFGAEERHFLLTADLSERHARALLRIRDTEKRFKAMSEAARAHLNVADTEALIAEILGETAIKSLKNEVFTPKSAEFEKKAPQKGNPQPFAPSLVFDSDEQVLPSTTQARGQAQEQGRGQDQGQRRVQDQEPGQGIVPRKFALRDLTPLYNSIERTLGIFKKTGVAADFKREEDEFAARITIYIPKRG